MESQHGSQRPERVPNTSPDADEQDLLDDEFEPYPDWWFWLKVQHIQWDPNPEKGLSDRTPAELRAWEEGRIAQAQERMAAYDVLLHIHRHLLPERYGGKHRQWWRKKALWNMLDHIVKLVDDAVYHHPESKYPEG